MADLAERAPGVTNMLALPVPPPSKEIELGAAELPSLSSFYFPPEITSEGATRNGERDEGSKNTEPKSTPTLVLPLPPSSCTPSVSPLPCDFSLIPSPTAWGQNKENRGHNIDAFPPPPPPPPPPPFSTSPLAKSRSGVGWAPSNVDESQRREPSISSRRHSAARESIDVTVPLPSMADWTPVHTSKVSAGQSSSVHLSSRMQSLYLEDEITRQKTDVIQTESSSEAFDWKSLLERYNVASLSSSIKGLNNSSTGSLQRQPIGRAGASSAADSQAISNDISARHQSLSDAESSTKLEGAESANVQAKLIAQFHGDVPVGSFDGQTKRSSSDQKITMEGASKDFTDATASSSSVLPPRPPPPPAAPPSSVKESNTTPMSREEMREFLEKFGPLNKNKSSGDLMSALAWGNEYEQDSPPAEKAKIRKDKAGQTPQSAETSHTLVVAGDATTTRGLELAVGNDALVLSSSKYALTDNVDPYSAVKSNTTTDRDVALDLNTRDDSEREGDVKCQVKPRRRRSTPTTAALQAELALLYRERETEKAKAEQEVEDMRRTFELQLEDLSRKNRVALREVGDEKESLESQLRHLDRKTKLLEHQVMLLNRELDSATSNAERDYQRQSEELMKLAAHLSDREAEVEELVKDLAAESTERKREEAARKAVLQTMDRKTDILQRLARESDELHQQLKNTQARTFEKAKFIEEISEELKQYKSSYEAACDEMEHLQRERGNMQKDLDMAEEEMKIKQQEFNQLVFEKQRDEEEVRMLRTLLDEERKEKEDLIGHLKVLEERLAGLEREKRVWERKTEGNSNGENAWGHLDGEEKALELFKWAMKASREDPSSPSDRAAPPRKRGEGLFGERDAHKVGHRDRVGGDPNGLERVRTQGWDAKRLERVRDRETRSRSPSPFLNGDTRSRYRHSPEEDGAFESALEQMQERTYAVKGEGRSYHDLSRFKDHGESQLGRLESFERGKRFSPQSYTGSLSARPAHQSDGRGGNWTPTRSHREDLASSATRSSPHRSESTDPSSPHAHTASRPASAYQQLQSSSGVVMAMQEPSGPRLAVGKRRRAERDTRALAAPPRAADSVVKSPGQPREGVSSLLQQSPQSNTRALASTHKQVNSSAESTPHVESSPSYPDADSGRRGASASATNTPARRLAPSANYSSPNNPLVFSSSAAPSPSTGPRTSAPLNAEEDRFSDLSTQHENPSTASHPPSAPALSSPHSAVDRYRSRLREGVDEAGRRDLSLSAPFATSGQMDISEARAVADLDDSLMKLQLEKRQLDEEYNRRVHTPCRTIKERERREFLEKRLPELDKSISQIRKQIRMSR